MPTAKPTPVTLRKKRGAIKTTLSTVATAARVLDGELRMVEVTNYLDNINELVSDYGLTVAQAEALLES